MTTTTPQPQDMAPPPQIKQSPITWMRQNLFSTWYNALLTILIVASLFQIVKGFLSWAFTLAQWNVIAVNLPLFFVGRFPKNQYWRLWLLLGIIILLSGVTWGLLAKKLPQLFSSKVLIGLGISCLILALFPTDIPYRLLLLAMVALLVAAAWGGKKLAAQVPKLGNWLSAAWMLSFFLALWLMIGGWGLRSVSTNDWGGLLLTLFMSVVGIALCFPFGVLLALGRQSSLPVVRWLSTIYIEFVRGLPLITILFMGQVLLPFFLPVGSRPDRVFRAIVGLTMFSAAYLAENVRGGLQSLPRGQSEAARALGLNTFLTLIFIILPQALKSVIPAIVGQFISLFQDTTLLAIVGLVELLGISRSILANPKFIGRYGEVYIFIGVMYWLFCFAMSIASKRLEQTLNVSNE